MSQNPNYPGEYDATLGGQNPPPIDGAVLGGIKGVKQRFASSNENDRINALPQLIKDRQEGLDLAIQALKDSSEKVQLTAYKLLQGILELKVQQVILEFNPYRYFDCVYTLSLNYHPAIVAIHPNGETLISCSGGNSKHEIPNSDGSYTGGVYLDFTQWNLKTGNKLYNINERFGNRIKDSIECYALSSDTTTLAIGGTQHDNTIRIEVWNLHNEHLSYVISGQPLIESGRRSKITSMALSCNGKILAIGNEAAKISVWDLEASEEIYTFWKDLKPITALAVNADTKILAAGSSDNSISVWNLNNGKLIYNFVNSGHSILYLTINPNGQFLIVSDKNLSKIIKIWDLRTGHEIGTLPASSANSSFFTISPDSKVLVVCANRVMIYNLKTRKLLATLPNSNADSVAISPDGQTIATYKYKEIKVWRVP